MATPSSTLPWNSHGLRSLVGCSPWGRKESDTTEWLHFHFSLSCIGDKMATHSSILAWSIPWTEEPGGLPSVGSHRIWHGWSNLAAAAAACMDELDYKESWAPKNWCLWTVVLEKTLESPLDCKEIQPVYPKGNRSWIFIWRPDAEAETLILRPPDAKNWLLGKNSDAGKDWRQEDKGMTDSEMIGWHHLPWWTWVWARSSSWWWIGKPDVLQSMGLQRIRHDWATELMEVKRRRTTLYRISWELSFSCCLVYIIYLFSGFIFWIYAINWILC